MAVDLTLRLVRHGETAWSNARRYTGHADIALTLAGEQKVRSIELPAADYRSIWSSDLKRCTDTARLMGFSPETTPAIREFDFGDIEGMSWNELDSATQAGLLSYDDFVAPRGESVVAFAARVEGFVATLAAGLHLLFTHGGVIHHILRSVDVSRHVQPGEWVDVSLPVSRR